MLLDATIESFLDAHDLPSNLDKSLAFELFATYCIASRYSGMPSDIRMLSCGQSYGIDSCLVLGNGHLVQSIGEFEDILKRNADVSFQFLQAKKTKGIDIGGLLKYFDAVTRLLTQDQDFGNQVLIDTKAMWCEAVRKFANIQNPPIVELFFGFEGDWPRVEQELGATIDSQMQTLRDRLQPTEVRFVPLDSRTLFELYRQSLNRVKKVVSIPRLVSFPDAAKIEQAYIGLISSSEFRNLITDSTGAIMPFLFNDNVRDFQGQNPVNTEIQNTLTSDGSDAENFAALNNGVTIVAKGLKRSGDRLSLEDFQIVNGCQTANVFYRHHSEVRGSVFLPIKIIVTNDADLTNRIIRSTNRQTTVTDEAFVALAPLHKQIEAFFDSHSGAAKLWYERRSKQYIDVPHVRKDSVITLTVLVRSYVSICLGMPERCDRYFGELMRTFRSSMFREEDKVEAYYACSLIYNSVERYLSEYSSESRGYHRFKPHLSYMISRKLIGEKSHSLSSSAEVQMALYKSVVSEYCKPGKSFEVVRNSIRLLEDLLSQIGGGNRGTHNSPQFRQEIDNMLGIPGRRKEPQPARSAESGPSKYLGEIKVARVPSSKQGTGHVTTLFAYGGGVIETEEGLKLRFFSSDVLPDSRELLRRGADVSYRVILSTEGYQAADVSLLGVD